MKVKIELEVPDGDFDYSVMVWLEELNDKCREFSIVKEFVCTNLPKKLDMTKL